MRTIVSEKHLDTAEEGKITVNNWLTLLVAKFYENSINKLVDRYAKSLN